MCGHQDADKQRPFLYFSIVATEVCKLLDCFPYPVVSCNTMLIKPKQPVSAAHIFHPGQKLFFNGVTIMIIYDIGVCIMIKISPMH